MQILFVYVYMYYIVWFDCIVNFCDYYIDFKIIRIATCIYIYAHIYSFTGGIRVRVKISIQNPFSRAYSQLLLPNRLFRTWRLKAAVLRRKVTRILRSGAQQVSLKLIIGFSCVIALAPPIDRYFFLCYTTLYNALFNTYRPGFKRWDRD